MSRWIIVARLSDATSSVAYDQPNKNATQGSMQAIANQLQAVSQGTYEVLQTERLSSKHAEATGKSLYVIYQSMRAYGPVPSKVHITSDPAVGEGYLQARGTKLDGVAGAVIPLSPLPLGDLTPLEVEGIENS